MRSNKLPILLCICLQIIVNTASLGHSLPSDSSVEDLLRIPEKNWQSDYAAWYEGRQENIAKRTAEKQATPHCMIAKTGDRFRFRHFAKWIDKDGSFVYERVDFVLDDQLLRADFAKSGIRLTGRLKRGDSDEWVHYAAGTFGQLGWLGPERTHSLRAILTSDQTNVRIEQSKAIAECKLQNRSGETWNSELRFMKLDSNWFLKEIRNVYSEGFTVQVRDIEYVELDELWIVKSCVLEAGTTRDGEFTPTVRDSIRLSDFRKAFSPDLLEIEELQDGMPVEVEDLPVACEYRDRRIVVSSLANIGQAIETNAYTPSWTNRLPAIFFALLLLVGMALLAYKASTK